jgi:hypothetical protein
MLYLLLAVALCLLAPWLPVWMYRSLPRRPAPPLSEGELHRLAEQLRQGQPGEAVEVVPAEDTSTRSDITRRPGTARGDGGAGGEGAEGEGTPRPQTARAPVQAAPRAARRLSLGSYRWLNGLMAPFLVGTLLALSFGWGVLFHYLGEGRARSFPPAVFLLKPFSYGIVCGVPAVFLGIFTSIPLLVLLARLLIGRRRFLEYLFWDEGRLGTPMVDALIRMTSLLALLVGVLSAAFVLLVFNWYARFGCSTSWPARRASRSPASAS